MENHIRQSNLIENIDDPTEDRRSLKAWNWFIKQVYITQPVLLELHRRITSKQLRPSESGQYRRVVVYVGNHIAPAPAIMQGQIYGWLKEMSGNYRNLDPKEMHIEFEKIHPFIDGNGRTGRMCMWWHQAKIGQPPTVIQFDNRQEYYGWFKEQA